MFRRNTILTTALRLTALATLCLIINVVIHMEVYSEFNPKPPSLKEPVLESVNAWPSLKETVVKLVSTQSNLLGPVLESVTTRPSLKERLIEWATKIIRMEDLIYIQCPSDGDFGDEAWKDLECKKRLPSVLGVGFQRCGLTALNLFLSTHPVIKHTIPYEVAFWNRNKNHGVEWYQKQMPVSSKYQETMETTSTYIFDDDAPKMISSVKPDMKFIVLVCDPIVRAMSDFMHLHATTGTGYQDHFEGRPHEIANGADLYLAEMFDKSVLGNHQGHLLANNPLFVHGQYIVYVNKWLKYFPMRNFLFLDGKSFKTDPLSILRQVEDFLQIPRYFDTDNVYYDTSKGFFCRSKPSRVCTPKGVGRQHPPIASDVYEKLETFYRKYNKEIELLIGKNFTLS